MAFFRTDEQRIAEELENLEIEYRYKSNPKLAVQTAIRTNGYEIANRQAEMQDVAQHRMAQGLMLLALKELAKAESAE